MSNDFGDFNSIGSAGVEPNYKSIPTDARITRSWLHTTSPLPKMYYDLKEQDRRRAIIKLTNKQ
jgi:hypothetical protein